MFSKKFRLPLAADAAATALVLFGLSLITSTALAQPGPRWERPGAPSQHCYKGVCDDLIRAGEGSNFGSLDVALPLRQDLRVAGVAGGEVDASRVLRGARQPCVGFVSALPDHIIEVERGRAPLEISVSSAVDTTLIVEGPDGLLCDDDTIGLNPLVRGDARPGTYRIWVGTYRADQPASYELSVQSQGASPPEATTFLTDAQRAEFGEVQVRPRDLRDAGLELQGRSGGTIDARYLRDIGEPECVGFADALPDHIVTVTNDLRNATLTLRSRAALTLLVHGPDGWTCVRASDDTPAALAGLFPAGTYRIWVASPRRNLRADYRLALERGTAGPVPDPNPRPERFSFRGQIEDLDVAFAGPSLEALFDDCVRFVGASSSLRAIDDLITPAGTVRNRWSYWSAEAVCGLIALNAERQIGGDGGPLARAQLSATIEEWPLHLVGTPVEIRASLDRFIPLIFADVATDDMTIDGRNVRNRWSYWNSTQLVAILAGNIDAAPRNSLVARGTFEDTPFILWGQDAAQLANRCERFFTEAMGQEQVDDLSVAGETRRNSFGYWSAAEACMIVSTLARVQ